MKTYHPECPPETPYHREEDPEEAPNRNEEDPETPCHREEDPEEAPNRNDPECPPETPYHPEEDPNRNEEERHPPAPQNMVRFAILTGERPKARS